MRIFGHAYFWKISYEKIAWSSQNPYRRWRCLYWKTAQHQLGLGSVYADIRSRLFLENLIRENRMKWSKSLSALKVFSLKTASTPVRIGGDLSKKARMRLSKNRPILRLYGLRIKINTYSLFGGFAPRVFGASHILFPLVEIDEIVAYIFHFPLLKWMKS